MTTPAFSLVATCGMCAHQTTLPEQAEGMRAERGYERWCEPCKRTTWHFVGTARKETLVSGGRGRR